jgi:transcriptional regulator with XRE-family HTH domain
VTLNLDTLGTRLRYLRRQRGLTLADVEKETGISAPSLSGIENDKPKDRPGRDRTCILAAYYRVSVDWILLGGDSPGYQEEVTKDAAEVALLHVWRSLDERRQREAMLGLYAVAGRK